VLIRIRITWSSTVSGWNNYFSQNFHGKYFFNIKNSGKKKSQGKNLVASGVFLTAILQLPAAAGFLKPTGTKLICELTRRYYAGDPVSPWVETTPWECNSCNPIRARYGPG
jgi:hypothetical protein